MVFGDLSGRSVREWLFLDSWDPLQARFGLCLFPAEVYKSRVGSSAHVLWASPPGSEGFLVKEVLVGVSYSSMKVLSVLITGSTDEILRVLSSSFYFVFLSCHFITVIVKGSDVKSTAV